MYYDTHTYIYRDSQLNRPESVLLASLARRLDIPKELTMQWLCVTFFFKRRQPNIIENVITEPTLESNRLQVVQADEP